MSQPRAAFMVVLGLTALAAALLTRFDLRLASSQAIILPVSQTSDTVPLDDPYAGVWGQASPVEIPLSAQEVTAPMGGGSARAVTARALHDGQRIYFLLEWKDATADMSLATSEEFRDAAAVQFPVGDGTTLPSFCMGQANAQVNIWQWKADWQRDIDEGFVSIGQLYPGAHIDAYPFRDENVFYPGRAAGNPFSETVRFSPVENLMAAGFGTLQHVPDQPVTGVGRWKDGRWRVLFARDLTPPSLDEVRFAPGDSTNVAFAVWDGANGERDGQKSVSQFAELQISGELPPAGINRGTWVLVIALPVGLATLLAGSIGWYVLESNRSRS